MLVSGDLPFVILEQKKKAEPYSHRVNRRVVHPHRSTRRTVESAAMLCYARSLHAGAPPGSVMPMRLAGHARDAIEYVRAVWIRPR